MVELLHAEIDIEEEPADRFDASCVKLYQPAQASGDLQWITAARLSFRHESGKGKLYISSDRPLRDPAVKIGVQSTCPGSRVWREYTVLVAPTEPAKRETESALSVARPARPVVAALPANKTDRISLSAPDTDEAAPRVSPPVTRPVRTPGTVPLVGASASEREPLLRMASELGVPGAPGEAERDALRLEYRLLTSLHEQADSQLALAEKLRRMQRDASELKAAGEQLGASVVVAPAPVAPEPPPVVEKTEALVATPTSVQPPVPEHVVPKNIPQAGPQAIRPADDDTLPGWLLYAGLGIVLLSVVLLAIRRRRVAVVETYLSPMHAPTIIVDEPGFSQPPEKAAALPIEVVEPELVLPVAPAVPQPPDDKLDVTPVMELAEIMLSFGRIQGAAQTLQEYIEAHPKEALQPWIRLLEIYRGNGMRTEFETLAESLNRNFNVAIVDWDNAAPGERLEMTLELLPHIRDQIDAMWGSPECLIYLQKLLHDNRDGQRTGFALPVVKEILLLIDLMVAEKAAA